ncbi:hypothetical protein [Streptomyces sp. G1]|uniref:hypothetical protein n=1 Tax=Streptomyces sp. G1 TaxID=361572 RepID=UPI0035AB6E71
MDSTPWPGRFGLGFGFGELARDLVAHLAEAADQAVQFGELAPVAWPRRQGKERVRRPSPPP